MLGLLLVPYVIPHIVGATMFSWLFNSNYGGVITWAIERVTGIEILWMTDTWPNRILLALNIIWSMLPFAMLIIMAGLQAVPDEILEAAKMDGASPVRTHLERHRAEHPRGPRASSPSSRSWTSSGCSTLGRRSRLRRSQIGNESIMLYIYNVAFRDGGQDLGLGSAINVLLILLIVVLLCPFIRGVAREGKTR